MTVKLTEVRDINNDHRKYYRVVTPNDVKLFRTLTSAERFVLENGWKYEYEKVTEEM